MDDQTRDQKLRAVSEALIELFPDEAFILFVVYENEQGRIVSAEIDNTDRETRLYVLQEYMKAQTALTHPAPDTKQ